MLITEQLLARPETCGWEYATRGPTADAGHAPCCWFERPDDHPTVTIHSAADQDEAGPQFSGVRPVTPADQNLALHGDESAQQLGRNRPF